MRQPKQAVTAGGHTAGTSLSSLVSRLSSPNLKDAVKSQTLLTNEISSDFCIPIEASVEPIIEELLSKVIRNARNGRIHITAERYRDIIVLEIEERNNYNGYALACMIQALEPLARSVGGYLSIKGQQQLATTISFSFPLKTVVTYDC